MGKLFSSYEERDLLYHNTKQQEYFNRRRCSSCSKAKSLGKMTFFKRCLIVFFLQIGCLALDHSSRDLAYEEDEIRLIVGNSFPTDNINVAESGSDAESEKLPANTVIAFHPRLLDFHESPVGMARLGLVRVDNRLKDENLKLISISGNTVNFQSSFFADKVISPGNTTTFDVVFLSREEGQVESNLYIHTSKGLFKYQVRGVGLPNPYRLRPLVGARIPVNASYEPVITLHNPHTTRIQVVEMLSSGTDFSLTLPDNISEQEAEVAWGIDPFQTKPVMKGNFQGRTEGNHTGYIKIKVNHTDDIGVEYLLVPVEVQVSSAPGIYSPQDSLNFGLLVQSDKPKTLSLSLINAQASPVNVQSVSVKGEANPALRIEFRPVVIEPDISASTVVALITFDPLQVTSVQHSSGFIEIQSECGKSITVPFQATVLPGELEYNSSSLGFFVKAENIPPRNFSVRNNFSTTVAIYQVTVNHPDIVQIDSLNQSHVIPPGEQKTIFTLKVQKKSDLCDSKSNVQLTLKSNVTNLNLPITCYDGKLRLHSSESGHVDFGRMELHSTHTEYFSVDNVNPIEIRLKSWGSNSSWSQVELVGMQKGVKEDLTKIHDFDNLKKSLFLQSGHMAVFSIDIRRPTLEGTFYGESYVTTDHNQTLRVPFHFSVSKGSVHCDTVVFDKAFPGKISFEKLYLSSSFNHTVNLLGLRAYPKSSVWFSASSLQEQPEISPHRKSFVGKLHFDPRKFCGQQCYCGFSIDTQLGKDWLKGMALDWETGEIDTHIFDILQARFQDVKDATVSNISLWVDTSSLTGFKVKANAKYVWPRLSSTKVIIFPLTALGNESSMDVPISNPSSSPIILQAALTDAYGPSWSLFIRGFHGGGNLTEGRLVFSMDNVSSSSHSNSSVIFGQGLQQTVLDILGLNKAHPGFTFVVPPGAKFLMHVKFKPLSKEMASTLLFLRNNLTGIETVWLKGRAGTGQLTVGNGTPGSSLLFQLTEKLLQGCQAEPASKYVPPQLTVRRSFIARNVGEIPLDINALEVYPPQGSFWSTTLGTALEDGCEGYGFRILNCHPFTLQPNQTHSIDIAFTPDFTLSKVVRSLRLTDSTGGHFNYSLVALIPSGMLSICASIISRPAWEPYFKILLLVGAIMCIAAAAMMSYFEAGSVVSSTIVTVRVMPKEPDGIRNDIKENTTKLDLKAVYDKVENRFKRNQKETQKPVTTGISVSSISSKIPAQHDPGSAVSNGNIRQRKTKKPVPDTNATPNAKLADKSNHTHLSRSNSHLSSTEDINDSGLVSHSSANLNNHSCSSGKKEKDKENATSLIGKKKKNAVNSVPKNQPQPPQGKKKLRNKNDIVSSTAVQEKNSQKMEEETSSTTTESSNPDDFISSFPISAEKYKKQSVKGDFKGSNGQREKQDMKKESSSNENISGSNDFPSLKSLEENKKKPQGKKKDTTPFNSSASKNNECVSPKLEMSPWDTPSPTGNGLMEFAAQSEAFKMHTRRNYSEGDQLSSNPGVCGSMNSLNMNMPTGNLGNSLIHQQSHQMSNIQMQQQHQLQNRPKKPGVIGQPRAVHNSVNYLQQGTNCSIPQSLSPGSGTSFSSYSNGINHFSNLGQPTSMSSNPNSGRQTTSPSMGNSASSVNNAGSIWAPDPLPDTGCDIWSRKNIDPAAAKHAKNLLVGRHDYPSRVQKPGFGIGTYQNMTNGYTNIPSTSVGNNSSVQDNPFAPRASPLASQNQLSHQPTSMPTSSGLPGSGGSGLPTTSGTDSSYLFNGGILSNLWQMNSSTYGETSQYRSQRFGSTQQQPNMPYMSSTSPSTATQHAYVQRMRSDPAVRSQNRFSNPSKWPTYGEMQEAHALSNLPANAAGMGLSGNLPSTESERTSSVWPPSTTTSASNPLSGASHSSMDSNNFGEWRAIGQSVSTAAPKDAEIWDSVIGRASSNSNKWPTSYSNSGGLQQSSYTDSMAVGSGQRSSVGVRQDDSNNTSGPLNESGVRGRSTDISQNVREVEAGLGFNPFTSDIWNHSEGSTWNNPYRYPSNE